MWRRDVGMNYIAEPRVQFHLIVIYQVFNRYKPNAKHRRYKAVRNRDPGGRVLQQSPVSNAGGIQDGSVQRRGL